MAADNKLKDIIQASLESIRTVVDANTVIGTPINTPQGATIIPVSKISVGFASGGLDYDGKAPQPGKGSNFGGGGGTGMSVTPVGFLVVDPEGAVSLLNLGEDGSPDTIGQIADLVEKSPEIIAKIKAFFSKRKKRREEEKEADDGEDDTVRFDAEEPQK